MKTKKLIASILMLIMLVSMVAVIPNYVQAKSELESRLTGIYLKDNSTLLVEGGRVGVTFAMTGDLSNVSVNVQFYSPDAGKQFNADLHGIGTNDTYFTVPSNVQEGRYYMVYVTIIDSNEKINCSTTPVKDANGNIAYPYINTNGQNCLDVYIGADGENVYDDFGEALRNLSFKQNTANIGDEVRLNFSALEAMDSMWFKFYNSTTNSELIAYVGLLKQDPYIKINGDNGSIEGFKEGLTYTLKKVSIYTDNYSNEHVYSLNELGVKEPTLTINKKNSNDQGVVEEAYEYLKGINFIADDGVNKSVTANLNDSVNVELDWEGTAIKSAMFSLKNKSTSEVITVYLKGLSKQPYFIIPYTSKAGEYELDYVIITDEEGNKTHYRLGKATADIRHMDFGCTLTINDTVSKNAEGIYEFDNAYINEYIDIIKNLEDNIVITIDANENTIIPEELFSALQDKDKTLIIDFNGHQWIFYGKDIFNPKEIDVSFVLEELKGTTSKPLTSMMSYGMVLDFAENGYLPGKSLIRIKVDEVNMEGLDEGKPYYTYYFDETNNMLDRVTMDKIVTEDGYYEFYINHNSTYVITNEEVDSKYISSKTDDLELNQQTATNSTTTTMETKKENTTAKMDENLTLKIIIIILCIFILIIILCGKKFFVGIRKDQK